VRDRIQTLAGAARSTDVPVWADAVVTRSSEGRLHLELVVHAGDLVGARSIEGRSCEDLAGATAVALALLLKSSSPLSEDALAGRDANEGSSGRDASEGSSGRSSGTTDGPSAAARESKKEEPPASPLPMQKAEVEQPGGALRADRHPTRRLYGLLRAPLGTFALGPLPEPSIGVTVAAGVSFERLRILVEGSAFRSQRMTAKDDPGTGADVHRIAAGLQGCWAFSGGHFEVAPCLTFSLEHLNGRGSGEHIAPRTGSVTWPAAGIGVQARWRILSWFGLFGAAGGQVEGSRPRLAIDGVGTLGQTWPGSLTVTLGPEWIL
jgi:hypothetical protein